MRNFHVLIERDSEGYYVASVPALPGCHTQARSLDEPTERIKEAIALYLEVETEAPEPLDFVGIQQVTIASLTPDERTELTEIVRKRLSERAWKQLIEDVRAARREFAEGGARLTTVDELMDEVLSRGR